MESCLSSLSSKRAVGNKGGMHVRATVLLNHVMLMLAQEGGNERPVFTNWSTRREC